MKIIVINGSNLNMLGIREPDIYGKQTYQDLVDLVNEHAKKIGVDVEIMQSNHEGVLVDRIQDAYFENVDGIVINPGAYTHSSTSILDALKAVNIPTVEVHISDVNQREEFRKFSYIALYAEKRIIGHGLNGYLEALDYLKEKYGN